MLVTRKGRDEHYKRVRWEMKIGYETVHAFEFIAGYMKNIGFARAFLHCPVVLRGGLKGSAAGCTDANNAFSGLFCGVDQLGRALGT